MESPCFLCFTVVFAKGRKSTHWFFSVVNQFSNVVRFLQLHCHENEGWQCTFLEHLLKFCVSYLATWRFFRVNCQSYVVTMLYLCSDQVLAQKQLGKGSKKTKFWLKIPVLVTAWNCPEVSLKIYSDVRLLNADTCQPIISWSQQLETLSNF